MLIIMSHSITFSLSETLIFFNKNNLEKVIGNTFCTELIIIFDYSNLTT